jgi:hypothetical protein
MITGSILFQGGRYMLVFHERNEEGKVRIQLLDNCNGGKEIADTYEHFSELRGLNNLITGA